MSTNFTGPLVYFVPLFTSKVHLLKTRLNFFDPFLGHTRVFGIEIVRSSTGLELRQ